MTFPPIPETAKIIDATNSHGIVRTIVTDSWVRVTFTPDNPGHDKIDRIMYLDKRSRRHYYVRTQE